MDDNQWMPPILYTGLYPTHEIYKFKGDGGFAGLNSFVDVKPLDVMGTDDAQTVWLSGNDPS